MTTPDRSADNGRRTALVTGAARRIGLQIATRLAAAGWDLVLHASARSLSRAEAEAERLAAAHGVKALARSADLADAGACAALVEAARAALGRCISSSTTPRSSSRMRPIRSISRCSTGRSRSTCAPPSSWRAPSRRRSRPAAMRRSSTSSTSGCCGPPRSSSPTRWRNRRCGQPRGRWRRPSPNGECG